MRDEQCLVFALVGIFDKRGGCACELTRAMVPALVLVICVRIRIWATDSLDMETSA